MSLSAAGYYAYQQTQKDDEPLRLPASTRNVIKQSLEAGKYKILKSLDTPNGKVSLIKTRDIYSIVVGKKMKHDYDDEETALRVFSKYQQGEVE